MEPGRTVDDYNLLDGTVVHMVSVGGGGAAAAGGEAETQRLRQALAAERAQREEVERANAQMHADAQAQEAALQHERRQAQRQAQQLQQAEQQAEQQAQQQLRQAQQAQQQLQQAQQALAAKDAELQQGRQALGERDARIAQLETAVAEARSGAGEAALAAQWRERYEAAAAERDGAKKRGEQLEGDYAKYRAKAMAVLEEKEKLLGEGGDGGARRSGGRTGGRHGRHGGNGAAGDAALSLQQVAYLKNIVLQYMSEPAVREHMEGAISTVLQFTPAEVARVQKARPLKAGWAGAALSMMGAGKR